MSYLIVYIIAFLASGLTFFSGFGLGTLLLPAFSFFFPLDISVALTAIVHLLNNIFKLFLVGKKASLEIVLRFGTPALLAAVAGAGLLHYVSGFKPLFTYQFHEAAFEIVPVKLVISLLMIFFALFDLIPAMQSVTVSRRFLIPGGALTGFLGGLSGHQGALRSMFLIRAGMSKESFIATGVVIACVVDVSRLSVYSDTLSEAFVQQHLAVISCATLCAFAGAFIGSRLVKKTTVKTVQVIVGVTLLIFALAMGLGLI